MKKKNGGFVSLIIMIIIALAAAKYFFGWSIFSALSSEEGQGTVSYLRDIWNVVWGYIGNPLTLVWEKVLHPLINLAWQGLQKLIELGKGAGDK